MFAQSSARTYRTNAVLTATPGQLVLMLYDATLKALDQAREAFARPESDYRRIEVINTHLLKAQAIIAELQSGLNVEAGGEVARTMQSLYEYHSRRLFEANLRKQVEPVIEVERLVRELRDAWSEMLNKHTDTASREPFRSVA